ncbi:MAG: hypothetical protein JNM56_06170 [Planctomycetia bacterium]|nr:hypothetical protein [Planctomycetia bacterium]
MATIQLPDVIALLFADDVHHDLATGKFSILGTYSSLAGSVFPWMQPALIVYLAFTDGSGTVPMKIRLVDADEIRPAIFESDAVIHFSDPTATSEHAFFQNNVLFPEAGEYRLQLIRERTADR